MKPSTLLTLLAAAILFLLIGTSTQAAKLEWLPITPEDLAATSSPIDPDADSEILYRYQETDDDLRTECAEMQEYIRIKIYTPKGVERFAKIDIPYDKDTSTLRAKHVEARIIKPDGTIIPVDKKSFYTRDLIRYDKRTLRALSFSFPTIEPGSIIEYRYTMNTDRNLFFIKIKGLA